MVAQELIASFTSLGQAVGHLFKGEFAEMTGKLLVGGSAIGLFLVIMFLMKFVLEITIFKNSDHKKYATWMAVGISLIGITNDSLVTLIYNVMGGSLPIILLILLAVFAIIIFLKKMQTNSHQASAEMHDAHREAVSSRKDLNKEDHDLTLQTKMETREMGAISKAEHIVDDEISKIKTLKDLVAKMRALLGQLAQVTDQAQAQQLRASLTRGAQALPSILNEDLADEKKLDAILKKIGSNFHQEMILDGKEQLEVSHLHQHLARQIADERKVDISIAQETIRDVQYESQLANLVSHSGQLDIKRKDLLVKVEQIDRAELSQTAQLRTAVNQLIAALNEGNNAEALTHIATIDQLSNSESAESVQLRQLIIEEKQLTVEKKQFATQMKNIVMHLKFDENKEEKELAHDEHDERDSFRRFKEALETAEKAKKEGDHDYRAKLDHLNGILKEISEKEGEDNMYLQKITLYMAKFTVNADVVWHHK